MKFRLTVLILLIINVPLQSRDIDLDAIYLKSGSRIYADIVSEKERLYSDISSLFIDSNVIYAVWSGGEEILYIKEFRGINIVYIYTKGNLKRRELGRFPGTVTAAVHGARGNLVTFKTIYYNDNAEAESRVVHVDLITDRISAEESKSLFLDFSPAPRRRGVIRQNRDGIFRKDPFTGARTKIHSAGDYSGMQCNGEPVITYLSHDGRNSLLVCGSGGNYSARLFYGGRKRDLSGISSAGDIRWISNDRFVYRSGGAGDYSVRVYDAGKGRSFAILSGTMNPDIHFSEKAGLITCLDNQVINIFTADLRKKIITGVEGEESTFSPDGRKFISLYRKKLYVTSLTMLQKYQIEIRRRAENILSLYKKANSLKNDWENGYTSEYLSKKISQYEKVLKRKTK
ncbi:MAG TPA: hypothetical protein PK906_02730 [Spirochaetota bacterium]|nr:hypothetical protein [Spirochaetota bacterium]